MIYYFLLFLIIVYQFIKKRENIFYLNLAFYLFLLGALLRIVTLNDFSEFLMRTSFILFLVGLILSYRGGGGTTKPK